MKKKKIEPIAQFEKTSDTNSIEIQTDDLYVETSPEIELENISNDIDFDTTDDTLTNSFKETIKNDENPFSELY